MSQLTITEALAELKTISKRVEKKRGFIKDYISRQDGVKDPLERDGGSAAVIAREFQAIGDLNARHVKIRTSIQAINQVTNITILDQTYTIAEWLTWRKEIANGMQQFVNQLRMDIMKLRNAAHSKGIAVVKDTAEAQKPTDLIINLDEAQLGRDAEVIEQFLGTLDGQLSLKNATIVIDV